MKKIILSIAMVAFLGMTACGGGGEKTTENAEKTPETKEIPKKGEDPKIAETDKTEAPTKPSAEGMKIAKKWKMTKFTHADGKEETEKGNTAGKVMNLKADGTFEQTVNEKVIVAGNWKLDGKNLVLKSGAAGAEVKEEKLTIKSSDEKQLVTMDDGGKMTETFEVVK